MLSIPKRGVRQGTNPNRFSPRSMGQFRDSEAAGLVLIPLHGPFDVRRIKDKIVEMGKAPADKDWTRKRYDSAMVISDCFSDFRNVGNRLKDTDLCIDIDPRNGGRESYALFKADHPDFNPRLFPRVITGGGGVHIIGRKPAALKVAHTLARYPGLEFCTKGRQLVAPGSIHPTTFRMYRWDERFPDISARAPAMPASVLKTLEPPPRAAVAGGQIDNDQAKAILAALPVRKFRAHDEWLQVMMALHHASGGGAIGEFIAWSTSDPEYSGDDDWIEYRWDTFDASRNDGVTYRTLNYLLRNHGAPNLQIANEVGADFDEKIIGEVADDIVRDLP